MPESTDQISLNDAVTYTTNWRNDNPNSVNSFLVSMDDLRGLVSETTAAYARIYLGIDGLGLEKIMLVGADGNKQDIILDLSDPSSTASGIYDFSSPCPPVCDDPTSPLATGRIPS